MVPDLSKTLVAVIGFEPLQAEKIQIMLSADAGIPKHRILIEGDFDAFIEFPNEHEFDAIILGCCQRIEDDLEAIRQLSVMAPAAAIIYSTDHEDVKRAAAALGTGAQDVLVKRSISGFFLMKALIHGIERAKLRNALRMSNQRLARLNEEKNRFLGMAAHDLRGPIGTIGVFADLILADVGNQLGSDNVRALQTIKRSSTAMVHLIEELLDMSKIESGKHSLQLSHFNLKEFIDQRICQYSRMAQKKNIILEWACDGVTVCADAEKLTQVMDNLISNAMKYSWPGSRVRVEGHSLVECVEVRVQDWGPGISDAEIKKLFDPFFRGAAKPTAGEQSTGLGLPIVKGIISEHHGQVGVSSELGSGSIFWFRLPQPPLPQNVESNACLMDPSVKNADNSLSVFQGNI